MSRKAKKRKRKKSLNSDFFLGTPNGIRIILSHGVEYGIYLEFAHEKRYAVIYPTLRRKAPDVMSGLQGLFDRLGGR